MEEAQSGKADVQRLADRVSAVFVPIVLVLAVAHARRLAAHGPSGDEAFTAAVAVLIIACPCALGLATPTALLVGTGRGAQLGILIKGPEVLESTQRGRHHRPRQDRDGHDRARWSWSTSRRRRRRRGEALRLVGALEAASEHPIGRAIAAAPPSAGGPLPAVESFANRAGLGVEGVVDGHAASPAGPPARRLGPDPARARSRGRAPTPRPQGSTAVLAGVGRRGRGRLRRSPTP